MSFFQLRSTFVDVDQFLVITTTSTSTSSSTTTTTSTSSSTSTSTSTSTTTTLPPDTNLVQSQCNSSNPAGVDLTATFATNTTAGNLILVMDGLAVNGLSNWITSVTDSQGNTYVKITEYTNQWTLNYWYAANIIGGACTVTVHHTSNNNPEALLINEYTGLSTVSPVDVYAEATGNTTGLVSSGTTAITHEASELVVGSIATASAGAISAGASFGNLKQCTPNGVFSLASEDKFVTSTGTQVADFTIPAGSNPFNAVVITFNTSAPTTTSTSSSTTTTSTSSSTTTTSTSSSTSSSTTTTSTSTSSSSSTTTTSTSSSTSTSTTTTSTSSSSSTSTSTTSSTSTSSSTTTTSTSSSTTTTTSTTTSTSTSTTTTTSTSTSSSTTTSTTTTFDFPISVEVTSQNIDSSPMPLNISTEPFGGSISTETPSLNISSGETSARTLDIK